jgi:hypothetical protein
VLSSSTIAGAMPAPSNSACDVGQNNTPLQFIVYTGLSLLDSKLKRIASIWSHSTNAQPDKVGFRVKADAALTDLTR